ncbi:MAG: response regulator [Flavobacteriaceae bacterium]|nr:response regulator [Flavobacteriaceae bacterium]MCI5088005.1 response regulator [Flavobacteriaceae bacterium]
MRKINMSCIIDDDPIFVYGTKKVMKEVDFCSDVIVYHNGQDAINGLRNLVEEKKELPSLIFLDLNMPVMDGWEFLDDFITIPNNNIEKVHVYVISSSIDANDFIRARNYEVVNNYILKPITPEDLVAVLKMFSNGL